MLNICLKFCLNCFVILYYVVLYLAYCINLVAKCSTKPFINAAAHPVIAVRYIDVYFHILLMHTDRKHGNIFAQLR